MDIVETSNEGLRRAYALTIPATEIDAKIEAEVKKVAPQIKMPGFRPGKVPANLVRKMHGQALHSEVLTSTVRESVDGLIRDKKLRPALQPKVDIREGYEQGKDAELTVELEVLPEFEVPDLTGLKLERLTVAVTDEALEEALGRVAANQKNYDDAPEGKQAADGDQLVIDFVGRVDGEEFEGGKAEGHALVLGSGQFIPGFEEQLAGATSGETRTITVTFPDEYPAEALKGRQAEFDVTVRELKVAGETTIDEDFAKSLGLESLDRLKELLRVQLEQETAGLTRTQMKRQLLDKLAKDHDFPVPQSMVDAEFEQIWSQLVAEAAREDDAAAAQREIEAEKDDYRRIAERRVRLGLLLSEIGQRNKVEITAQEMQMLMQQAAQQYRPEDRERFVEYVRQEPMAQAQIRAPLYEDKVIDFLFDQAEVTAREVTREQLEAAIEAEEDGSDKEPAEAQPEAGKPAATKKRAARNAADDQAGDLDKDASTEAGDEASKAPKKKASTGKSRAKPASGDKPEAAPEEVAVAEPATKPARKKASPKKDADTAETQVEGE